MIIHRFLYIIRKSIRKEYGFALAMPAVLWQAVFLLLPIGLLFFRSLFLEQGGWPTLANYLACFDRLYLAPVFSSLQLAYFTALFCLILCLPLALFINYRIPRQWRLITLFLLMMPSWTNFIIRIYSWCFLLRNDGLFYHMLKFLGFLSGAKPLLANYGAMLMVMVYCYFPYMLLPIYEAIAGIDRRILEASGDLGASSWQTFWRVIFPLALRGITFGSLVVILASFGEFAIPDFIGGGKGAFWGMLVISKFLLLSDHNAGSAVIFVGIIMLLLSLLFFYFLLKIFLRLVGSVISIPEGLLALRLHY